MHKSVQTAAQKFTRIQEIKSLTLRILKDDLCKPQF